MYRIEDFVNGDIDEVIDALITTDQASRLAGEED
jgi:peptide chain release factor 1